MSDAFTKARKAREMLQDSVVTDILNQMVAEAFAEFCSVDAQDTVKMGHIHARVRAVDTFRATLRNLARTVDEGKP
jgi:hypothetical protein